MISKAEAARLANIYISSNEIACVLLHDATLEESFGWVFFYQSKAYLESGNVGDMLGGNAPLVVFRDTGEVRATGTGLPLDAYLNPIREEWRNRQG